MKTWLLIFLLVEPSGNERLEAWSYPTLELCREYEAVIRGLDAGRLVSRCKLVNVSPVKERDNE